MENVNESWSWQQICLIFYYAIGVYSDERCVHGSLFHSIMKSFSDDKQAERIGSKR